MITGLWIITDHLCRECTCRLLMRADCPGLDAQYRCTGCGAEGAGAIEELCACGMRAHRSNDDLRYRCIPNPKRSATFPFEVVVARVPKEPSEAQHTQISMALRR